MSIFQKILESNSMTHIDYMLMEAGVMDGLSNPAQEVLKRVYESNDLDERWLLCHEWVGNLEEAQKIREWLAKKQKR